MINDYKSILVPVDFNEPSLKAAGYAAQLASGQSGEVILLNVIETPENVKFSTRLERGKPYVKILEAVKGSGIRMIALGENHDNEEQNAELGTTVYHVTLKASVPMLSLTATATNIDFGRHIQTLINPDGFFQK